MAEKKTGRKVLSYLRELSVVVLGIAITLIANDLIKDSNNKRDIEIYLNAVKAELEKNLEETVQIQHFYEITREFGEYYSTEILDTTINLGEKFGDVIGGFYYPGYKTSAFDMLKSSDVMHLIKDKIMLNAIWEAYNTIDVIIVANNNYMNRKEEEIYKHILTKGEATFNIEPSDERILTFFKVQSSYVEQFEKSAEEIRNTLALMEVKR